MSRYIDADKLTVYFEALAKQAEMEGLYNMAHIHNRCLQIIEDAPPADVVEVVRCKDCKYLTVVNNESVYARCEKTGYIFWPFETDTREHFCAYGERREENEG